MNESLGYSIVPPEIAKVRRKEKWAPEPTIIEYATVVDPETGTARFVPTNRKAEYDALIEAWRGENEAKVDTTTEDGSSASSSESSAAPVTPEAAPTPKGAEAAASVSAEAKPGEYSTEAQTVKGTKAELRQLEDELIWLGEEYDGLLERQLNRDPSVAAVAQPLLNQAFTRLSKKAKRGGEKLSREAIARQSVSERQSNGKVPREAIQLELAKRNRDWTNERIIEESNSIIEDFVTVSSMNKAETASFDAALDRLEENQSRIDELNARLEVLRTERLQRLQKFGSAAMEKLVNTSKDVRLNVRTRLWMAREAAFSKLSEVTGKAWEKMESMSSAKKRRIAKVGFGALAAAGIVAANLLGVSQEELGGAPVDAISLPVEDLSFDVSSDKEAADAAGDYSFNTFESAPPEGNPASEIPEVIGEIPLSEPATESPIPEIIGDTGRDAIPEVIGEEPIEAVTPEERAPEATVDMSSSDSTKELFSDTKKVDKWPDSLKVSDWNPSNKDGSLWGISEQMLKRSGIDKPSNGQISSIVTSLLDQAQPDGSLIKGQDLKLGPAVKVLNSVIK